MSKDSFKVDKCAHNMPTYKNHKLKPNCCDVSSSVPVQWTGFSDPQTGIQHFTWCVGTAPEICDVTPSTHTLLSSAAHGAGITLPVATPLYVTVRATNPAGLETVSVSDGFVGE